MQEKITKITNEYVENSGKNIDVNDMNIVKDFHNYLITECLGEPEPSYPLLNKPEKPTPLRYTDEEHANQSTVDVIYINNLYIGIAAKGNCKFNYDAFDLLIKDVYIIREEFKWNNRELEQYLLKAFLNYSYYAYEFPDAKLCGSRSCIVNNARVVMNRLKYFLETNGIKVYCINTDTIHVNSMGGARQMGLQEFFNKECHKYIDTGISNIEIEENVSLKL